MEKNAFLDRPPASPQLLHLFKHATLNFERKRRRYTNKVTGCRMTYYEVTKRKRRRYMSERSAVVPVDEVAKKLRARTRSERDEAIARYRARRLVYSNKTKHEVGDVLSGLSKEEQAALTASPHVVTAVEKIIEAMLFRFS